jgi:hypothetical protein
MQPETLTTGPQRRSYFNDFCMQLQRLYKSLNIIPFQVKFDIGLYFFTILSVEAGYFVYLNYLPMHLSVFALMAVHLLCAITYVGKLMEETFCICLNFAPAYEIY